MSNITDVPKYDFSFKNYVPILPLVYSDSLSYLETLAQCSAKLNEVIDRINSITTEAVEAAKAYTDEAIAKQNQYIAEAVADVQKIQKEIETANAQFIATVNSRIALQDANIAKINENLQAGLKSANYYTDVKIEQNNDFIMEEISKGLIDLKVLNYFTGSYVTVQEMFDYLAQFHLTNAISYQQLYTSEKTYNELIAINKTYTEWTVDGASFVL